MLAFEAKLEGYMADGGLSEHQGKQIIALLERVLSELQSIKSYAVKINTHAEEIEKYTWDIKQSR